MAGSMEVPSCALDHTLVHEEESNPTEAWRGPAMLTAEAAVTAALQRQAGLLVGGPLSVRRVTGNMHATQPTDSKTRA